MAPMAADPSFGEGVRSGDQASYLQQVLANTKASQQNEAQIKQHQNQMIVDPSVFRHGAGAQMANGATPDGKLIYNSPAQFVQARDTDNAKYDEKVGLDTNEAVANQAIKAGLVDSNHPAWGAVQQAAGRKPLTAAASKQMEDLGKIVSESSPGQQPMTAYGPKGKATPYPVNNGALAQPPQDENGRPYVTKYKLNEQTGRQDVSYEPASENLRAAETALLRSGWTRDMPGFDEAVFNMTKPPVPYQAGGGAMGRGDLMPKPPVAIAPAPSVPSPGDVGKQLLAAADQEPDPAKKAVYTQLAKQLATLPSSVGGVAVQPGQQPASTGRPQPTLTGRGGFQAPQKGADMADLKEIRGADKSIQSLDELTRLLDTPDIKAGLGGVFSNPAGALKQAGAKYLPTMLQPPEGSSLGLTQGQAAFNARLTATYADIRHQLYGSRITPAETALLNAAVPNGASDPYLTAKLATWRDLTQKYRDDIDRNLQSQDLKPVPQPSAGVSQAPVTKRWTRDASGNLVPMP